jgi:hypothetical protein
MTSRSSITFAFIFTKHVVLRDLMTMLKQAGAFLKVGTPLANHDIGATLRASRPT